jgi:hypothetical protein
MGESDAVKILTIQPIEAVKVNGKMTHFVTHDPSNGVHLAMGDGSYVEVTDRNGTTGVPLAGLKSFTYAKEQADEARRPKTNPKKAAGAGTDEPKG